MSTHLRATVAAAAIALCSCGAEPAPESAPGDPAQCQVLLASEVEWGQLNPARGAASPQAGTLFGDRAGSEATGFLFKPKDGFRSPPHIHNVSYRGVVIRGIVHNDDPDAEDLWMPKGSFWTQPQGEIHITAAQGEDTLAYIEIDRGPYLVLPVEERFETEERPINVHASNLVWVDWPGAAGSAAGVQCAYLWGDFGASAPHGVLLRLPAGFDGAFRTSEATLRAVVIEGQVTHESQATHGSTGLTPAAPLDPGSYVSSTGQVRHHWTNPGPGSIAIYLRAMGELRFD
ncbi:MAG: DUF4437 domain-containing protein [Planctomycetota bacterium]|jgi:hypothetical protein